MENLSKLLKKLCCKIIILLAFMLIELFILIKKLKSSSATTGPITTKQYLKFIEEKNPTICYSKRWLLKEARHVDCSVCLSEFKEGEKLRRLRCQHIFHRDCLDKWLQQYLATCPLCRFKVLPDDVVSRHRELRNQVGSGGENGGGGDRLQFLLAALRGGNSLNG